jgi:flagellar protein FlaJ
MIEELRKNIESQIEILRELSSYVKRLDIATTESEKKILMDTVDSLTSAMKIINNAVPTLLGGVSTARRLPGTGIGKDSNLEYVKFKGGSGEISVILPKKDREKFLKELSIGDNLIGKIKKKEPVEKQDKIQEFKAARGYVKLSNKFFLNRADNLIKKGYFGPLSSALNKANIDILFSAYVAVILFSSFLALMGGIVLAVALLFTNFSWAMFAKVIFIPILLPIATFFIVYYYPTTERGTIARRIEQELPFAVIHMSAISGSGIEPVEIFKIITVSKDYPFLRREIRKVLNQINLYGYDLVTALNNVMKNSPSQRLSELFAGLSTTISSGGSLTEFFQKRSETLLIDYRLEREKYTKVAETFMDIYISVVIAAPMILMLLLIMISISGFQIPFTPGEMTIMIILAIAIINAMFIGVLQLKQPTY